MTEWSRNQLYEEVRRLRGMVHSLNVAIDGLGRDIDARARLCDGRCGAFPKLRSTTAG